MGTVGIYDYDYMNYEHVIPNLECAKMYTYYHNRHEIAVLAPALTPYKYTNFYVRKEYDDGIYPPALFVNNCNYSGRAFNPDLYSPLPLAIERTIPNMHLYDRYKNHFGTRPTDQALIHRILNCAHIRLSINEETPLSIEQLQRIIATGTYNGVIFHDYNLSKIPQAYDIIYDISQMRHYKTKSGVRPFGIGNKFPIQLDKSDELQKWLKVKTMKELFCIQYNGMMPDDALYELCHINRDIISQIYYQIDLPYTTDNDFLMRALPKIYKQVLFLRMQNIKILLKYDDQKIQSTELKNFIDLLNCWLRFSWQKNFMIGTQTLYRFCNTSAKKRYTTWAYKNVVIPVDMMRDSFQYIRLHNYDLFAMLYENDRVYYQGGKFVL